jgi:uncharacterized protein
MELLKANTMKCPSCSEIDLLMSERQGIEIDYCPKCRGVWLDRGELDKFIQQAERYAPSQGATRERIEAQSERPSREIPLYREPQTQHSTEHHRRDDYHEERSYKQPAKKKESFWGELFDFG